MIKIKIEYAPDFNQTRDEIEALYEIDVKMEELLINLKKEYPLVHIICPRFLSD